ncbi:MAG: ATP-binding protein [Gammaproteobacteria bacterium]|nr:ATP-binding protein [Gammaproteobacteria bacterium]
MIPRQLQKQVETALSRQAAVLLVGPRQSGKTTLSLELARRGDAVYLDLEDQDDRSRLEEPRLFLDALEDRLVVFDEIHRAPELFASLRGVIDRGRRRGKGIGRFLILGSASIDLLRQSGESLAGRFESLELMPLSLLEIEDSLSARNALWLRGGFPQSWLAASDGDSLVWRRNFIRTYLERDIPQFGPRVPATTLERLWTMLAHRQGSLLNVSTLARALETSARSIGRYIDLFADLMLLRRLPPLHANVGKRLVKSPKTYVRDSGLVHSLLGISSLEELAGHPVIGESWEGFVIETLLGQLPWPTQASFYRTVTGAEIDLVLDFPGGERWAIEIKRSLSAKMSRGFHMALADIAPSRAFVVHAGDDRYPLSKAVEAIGVRELAIACRDSSLG